MTATNHGLAGAVIGLSLTAPAIALPVALLSHFVLDSVPHFGGIEFYKSPKQRRIFHSYLIIDAILLLGLIGFLIISSAGWLALACLFLAGCPDFVQAYKYLFDKQFRIMPTQNHWFTRFHKKIQWSETPQGLLVEIPLMIALFALVTNLL
jgi:hypothetical protein